MTEVRFIAMPTADAQALRSGRSDANGQTPERHVAEGSGNLCRHCLGEIAAGDPMLVAAYRPFPEVQPYAEVGPIFLHAAGCPRHGETAAPPRLFLDHRERMLVRGYKADDRIKYGTGQVVPTAELADACAALFEDPEVAYLHIRSAANNCYQCRVDKV